MSYYLTHAAAGQIQFRGSGSDKTFLIMDPVPAGLSVLQVLALQPGAGRQLEE
jgi:hypothetical protein